MDASEHNSLKHDIDEVQRVAKLVDWTQPIWSGQLQRVCELALKSLNVPLPEDEVSIPMALARSLAEGPDSLSVWELRGLLERVNP